MPSFMDMQAFNAMLKDDIVIKSAVKQFKEKNILLSNI